ncbi:aromatic amino acid ammonia-lyase [Terasakiella sp. A23]|uniref:HAL/PAL/TAL family ammonia-lyase n=1 Tax=Terasakiella sp. FCG-A23 TaxID=3080561 RepID=UPI0029541D57|nr:aromatic amino acid ammonia-lyase [Terasakiella sp. A23]MDV7341027.1 aromatic amino acid ammonia-lyase [Terasakiella sp. A23]
MPVITFGEKPLTIEDIHAIAMGKAQAQVSDDPAFVQKISAGADYLSGVLEKTGVLYGITTGYGDSCTRGVPEKLVHELPIHLSRFHGVGMGKLLTPQQSLGVVAVRLASLTKGMSGVSMDLMRQLELLLEHQIAPVIPEEGSVGASGDLTPLSYVAAVLIGERDVFYKGERRAVKDVYAELDIKPLVMRPKEALAIMNGTAVMTAMAVTAFKKADYLARLCSRLTTLTSIGLLGNPEHFDEVLFSAKPHPGQAEIAKRVRDDLNGGVSDEPLHRLQDRYSVRCAPHVIGVLQDMLPTFRQIIETEINSANDNPIIDFENERVLHGGHFYGGHIGFVMDSLKNLVANLADLVDRQMASLVDVKFNNGLPSNLSGAEGERAPINHGLKALQIGVSAWTAEALKNTMPASVFSRSTECHNQDKVSMGTIAARDCLRVLELTEQAIVGHMLACCQAVRLRIRQGELSYDRLSADVAEFQKMLEADIPFVDEDEPLEGVLNLLMTRIANQHWSLYE